MNFSSVNNIEEEAINLADKEGWITRNEFIRFASDTELCKSEIQDRVFSQPVWASGRESEPKKKSKDATKKDSRKVSKSSALVQDKRVKEFLPPFIFNYVNVRFFFTY